MTASQEIIWTALPWGHAEDGRPRLTAFVSPRLRTDAANPNLGEFPNFVTWPASVNAMTFTAEVQGQPGELPTTRLSPAAEATLWGHLFTDATTLRPFIFKDHGQRNLRSFPVESVMTYLSGLYQQIAQLSPEELPLVEPEDGDDPRGTLAGLVGDLGGVLWHYRIPHGPRGEERFRRERLGEMLETTGLQLEDEKDLHGSVKRWARHRRYHALDEAFASNRVIGAGVDPATLGFDSQGAMDFYQAHRFFDRPENEQAFLAEPDAAQIPPPPAVPEFDFHQAVAILGDYPEILRRLGLAIDLAVDGDLPALGAIRVVPHWDEDQPASSFATDVSPWTAFELDDDRFGAQPLDGSRMADGMLALDGASDAFESGGDASRYGVVQVDTDGAALKTVATAVNLRSLLADREQGRAAFDTPDRTGLSPMRSVGVAVFAKDRAVTLHGELADAAVRDGSPDLAELVHHAEHLVRGFRVDVFDPGQGAAGEWRSLCLRRGTYRLHPPAGGPVEVTRPDGTPIEDEGYVKFASTSSADDETSDLYLHETMFRWDGWSLVAKRPGRTIIPVPRDGGTRQDEEVGVPAPNLATEFKLETAFEPVPGSLPRLRFGQAYRFRVRAVDLAGNSIGPDEADEAHASGSVFFGRFDPINPPAIVPRAELTEGESIERMVIRSNYDQTTESYVAGTTYATTNDRHVVPPKTSQEMVERHGAFDAAFGPGGNPAAAFATAVREAATLEHTHVVVPGSDPVAYQPIAGSQMIPGKLPPDAPPGTEAQGAYLINTQALFPLAYLPDVLAAGAAFRGLPGTETAELLEFTGAWPDRAPFVIRIAESPGTVRAGDCAEALDEDPKRPHWDEATRVLMVYLPKATVAAVRYSCYPADLADLAAWRRWMEGAVDERLAAEGGAWMLSPFRELVLVHAVQQPLCPPTVRLDAWRSRGETFARLRGLAYLSVRSTGQLDLAAKWREPIDSLSEPGPKEVDGFGHVAAVRVDADLPEPSPLPADAPLPDGTLPWPQSGGLPVPFPNIADLPEGFQVTDPEAEGYLDPHDLQEFQRGELKHEFGDTKHRWVRYRLTGTTRFREYFGSDVTSDPAKITRTGDEVLVNIPASARPEAPKVQYIVPSWRWDQDPVDPSGGWTRFRRTRAGGGLRVWMDRPWYSSGEGERLGVIVWPGGAAPNERIGKRVSQFGMDPAWESAVPSPVLTTASFANEVDAEANLPLAELPLSQRVNVVAFEPEYEGTSRNLWFCDIDMSPKAATSYFPFVRLALARYQRHAIWEAKLSPVIQTDFHQLVPSRTLTLTRVNPGRLDVTLYGPAPDGPIRNRVEAMVEHHDGAIPGDLGWKPIPGMREPIHLSDGAPDISWIPPRIPWGLAPARDLRARVELRGRLRSKIARANLPTIEAGEAARTFGIDAARFKGVKQLPIFVLPGYELWSGAVPLPDDPALGRLRIVVREFEHFRADPEVGRLDRDRHDPVIDGPYLDRIVYADIVELP
jgi:hypothetical protein